MTYNEVGLSSPPNPVSLQQLQSLHCFFAFSAATYTPTSRIIATRSTLALFRQVLAFVRGRLADNKGHL